jgi:hypothetical protein
MIKHKRKNKTLKKSSSSRKRCQSRFKKQIPNEYVFWLGL